MEDNKKIFLQYTYNNSYKDKYYKNYEQKCKAVLDEWKEWRNKISSDSLSLDDYVNRKEENKYLIYFLNNTASVFGRSREGNANQWMIKLNKDSTYYTAEYIDDNNEKIPKNYNADKNQAEGLYNLKVKTLLKSVIECHSIAELKELVNEPEYKWFSCEQMLEKMMVLESFSENYNCGDKYCLPNFYKESIIDKLYEDYFELSEENITRVGKSYEIMKFCYNVLEISEPTAQTQFEVSRMLWDLANYNMVDINEDSPNVIFYGSPGTGKTYSVKKAIDFLTIGKSSEYAVFVQCHPGFGYEEFIEGLKPVGFTSNGSLKLEVVNGVFKDLCIKAKADQEHTYYFVADEINRANLSAMFGEALSLLEADYRDNPEGERNLCNTALSKVIEAQIKEQTPDCRDEYKNKFAYDYRDSDGSVRFGIPKNIRFIGMMNDVDKSIDSFDLALRRRFKWIRKDCDYDVINEKFYNMDTLDYRERCEKLNNFISQKNGNGLGFGKAYEFGHAYFLRIKIGKRNQITKSARKELFDEHLKPLLTEYIRSFKDDDEIDDVIKKAENIFVE